MKLFTEHPHQQGITYLEHARFAAGIAYRLISSAIVFALHAIVPAIRIEQRLDLEATIAFLDERNRWIENSKAASFASSDESLTVSGAHKLQKSGQAA